MNAEILNGRSGIHFAADYGQSNVIEYLLSKGADINVSFLSFLFQFCYSQSYKSLFK